jgi:ubiquitin C-terminal hydrolase
MPKCSENLGLCCYVNSLLQCFYHIFEFKNHFIENKDKYKEKYPIYKASVAPWKTLRMKNMIIVLSYLRNEIKKN